MASPQISARTTGSTEDGGQARKQGSQGVNSVAKTGLIDFRYSLRCLRTSGPSPIG